MDAQILDRMQLPFVAAPDHHGLAQELRAEVTWKQKKDPVGAVMLELGDPEEDWCWPAVVTSDVLQEMIWVPPHAPPCVAA